MDPKVKDKTGEKKKPKKMISMETKHEIIAKHERGVRIIDLANEYGCNPSTISTIIKQKEAIKKLQLSKGVTNISKLRTNIHDEMEQLLLLWIKEKQLAGDSISEAIICEKAGAIFQDLKRDVTETEGESSQGGERSKLLTILRNEVAFIQLFVMEKHLVEILRWLKISLKFLKNSLVKKDIYRNKCSIVTKQRYFGKKCLGARLSWLKKKSLPDEDRLMLALCANAIGGFKIKPLLLYLSENPRAFEAYKVMKEKLQVLWRANSKAWVTRQFFIEWMNIVFGPSMKKYLIKNGLPLKCVLLLDNAPAHPPDLEDDLLDEFKFIKVAYLPPNTTSTL
ncbi:tigger transposable element-derived protein 1 [Nephila pilipes]|uniref:Tigger transposable element-derived protein 1 n=1 Tax=Nephila pilipes TaxID=299642 RepID=A0A8X6QYP2_NEPPI|nr:tigger transposable element-derived protein 1 [Nephila pilipes]